LKYFPELSAGVSSEREVEFESFDPDARRGARMLALRKKIGAAAPDWTRREGDRLLDSLGGKFRERVKEDLQFPKFESTPAATNAAPEEELALPIAAIRRYLECPLQGAARYSLGMHEDEDVPEDVEDEPVEQSRLNRAVMLRKVFWRAGGKLDVIDEEYAREVRIAQARGHASAGQFAEAAKAADDSALRQWIAQASEAGVNDFDHWKDIQIGRADEFADAAVPLAPISLEADVRRHDGTTVTRRVSLYGTIRGVSPEAGAAINCVLRKSIKPKDFLPAFLNAIVLAATGAKLPEKFRAIVIRVNSEKNADWIREFKPLDQNSALAYLTAVVSDLLSTGNDYFLPIEAVEDVVKELHKPEDRRDLIEAVERTLLNNPPPCSSDYGPVRNPRDFDPPGEEEIEKIVARRFDPIIRVFGK
jgi:exodeoxyribonuclease V gamma subunit